MYGKANKNNSLYKLWRNFIYSNFFDLYVMAGREIDGEDSNKVGKKLKFDRDITIGDPTDYDKSVRDYNTQESNKLLGQGLQSLSGIPLPPSFVGVSTISFSDGKEIALPRKIHASMQGIIEAVADQKVISDVDIVDQILKSSADIIFTDNPELGKKLLQAFSVMAVRSRSKAGKIGSAITNAKRSKQADEYAIEMFKTVNNIKKEANVESFGKTVEELTKRNIPTPNGGKWNNSTLQHLYKRWDALGLKSDEPDPKKPQP